MAEEEKPKANGAESPIVIKLRKSVIANGDEVMELSFREPTAIDIERAGGNPVIIDMMSGDTPKITFDAKAMTQMMGLLAAVPPSTIRQMNPRDWNTAAWQLAIFFTPDL
jgi:Phage tail assembly chaperone proteins, E, or 41 or 14